MRRPPPTHPAHPRPSSPSPSPLPAAQRGRRAAAPPGRRVAARDLAHHGVPRELRRVCAHRGRRVSATAVWPQTGGRGKGRSTRQCCLHSHRRGKCVGLSPACFSPPFRLLPPSLPPLPLPTGTRQQAGWQSMRRDMFFLLLFLVYGLVLQRPERWPKGARGNREMGADCPPTHSRYT